MVKAESPRALEQPGKMYVKGKYLYVNEIKKGIHIIDNGNPASPKFVTFINIPGNGDIAVRDSIATVTLNRPEIHNAFDETLIANLTAAFVSLDDNPDIRVVVLAGAGRSFCAGADLHWMKRMSAFGREENLADANALAARRVGERADDR